MAQCWTCCSSQHPVLPTPSVLVNRHVGSSDAFYVNWQRLCAIYIQPDQLRDHCSADVTIVLKWNRRQLIHGQTSWKERKLLCSLNVYRNSPLFTNSNKTHSPHNVRVSDKNTIGGRALRNPAMTEEQVNTMTEFQNFWREATFVMDK